MPTEKTTKIREAFRRYKRCTSLLRDSVDAFEQGSSLTLNLRFRKGEPLQSTFAESSDLVRFAALLRPFIDMSSNLELSAIWAMLKSADLVDANAEETCSAAFAAAERLSFPFRANGRDLTPRDVLFAYGEGEFFQAHPEARSEFKRWVSLPGEPTLQFLFYSSCLNYAAAAFSVLEVILAAERNYPELRPLAVQSERCIYCLTSTGDFSAEEHVIPEAFGLDEIRLLGSVCTRCNNELSKLDQFLAEFEPLALLRVRTVPLTKKGKFPRADFRDFTLQKTKPRVLTYTSKSGRPIFERKDLPDGTFSLRNTFIGKKPLDAIRLGQSLFKIALGLVAFDHGTEYACTSRFDQARRFIRGEGAIPNHLVMTNYSNDLHGEIRTEWAPFEDGTPVCLDFFGIRFALNLQPSPFFLPREAAQLPLVSFWLGDLTKGGIVPPCSAECTHVQLLVKDSMENADSAD